MSDFKVKMHQNRFRLGLCPRSRWRAYSAPPGPLAVFKGPTSKGKEGEGGGRGREEGKGREGKGEGEGKAGEGEERPYTLPVANGYATL